MSPKNISRRSKSNLIRQILEEDNKSYEEISKDVTVDTLHQLAKKIFIDAPQRITVELFAKGMKDTETNFIEVPKNSLNNKTYTIANLEDIVSRTNFAN